MHHALTTAAIQALGFAAAAALCAMLLFMHRRVSTEVARGYAWFWVTGAVYASAAFAARYSSFAGADVSPRALHAAEVLMWSSTCFGPLIFAGLVEPHLRSARVQRAMKVAAYVALAGLALWLAFIASSPDLDVDESRFPAHSFYVSLLFAATSVILAIVNRPEVSNPAAERRIRWFAPVASALAIIQMGATLASIHDIAGSGTLRETYATISSLWILPWTVVLAFFFAQTRFADVALKRTITLIVSVAIAAGIAWFMPITLNDRTFTIATLTIAAIMLAAPALFRFLHRSIDRFLLRRPEYRRLEIAFAANARRSANADELLALATQTIEDALQLNARFLQSPPLHPKPLAMITVDAQRSLIIEDRIGARTLMEEEFAFLEAIAAHVGHRLESLRLEADRHELQINEERLGRSVTEAELKALRAQVDPHFLFNTLNAIADLISREPAQAEAMIERLAECFRYALSRQEAAMSTLEEELQFIRRYLDIEQVRFGHRLRVELQSDAALAHVKVPSLILQPLIENAIRHGLASKPEGGCVKVSASYVGEFLKVEVCDDGVGMQSNATAHRGIGLRNVRERLQLLYRDRAQMQIAPGALGCGTLITLLVPAS